MKLSKCQVALMAVVLLPGLLWAGSKDQKKEQKEAAGKKVDSGTFGVFVGGRRIGTETFSISQSGNGSIIQSEFKTEGAEPAAQRSEMQLTGAGELRRYEWQELSPDKAESTITPNEEFLSLKWSQGSQDKAKEQMFLLPSSTSILDDYFFVHREVLSWRFLASSCKQEGGQIKCPLKQRTQFGTLNPRQRASAPISMEFAGREKISLHGSEQELIKLQLKSEAGDWDLWLNDQLMLQRITILSEKTEVVRD